MELAASRIADSGMRRLGTVIDKVPIVPASTDERQSQHENTKKVQ
jgi:hypothetical protein